jgi:anti-anti-sigma factor
MHRRSDHSLPPCAGPAVMTGSREPPLAVEVDMTTETAIVVIRGELDLTTTPLLCRHLARIRDARSRRLVVDMSGVDFIDCAAARLIAGTGRFLPEGRRPVIRRPSPIVRRLLELTGLAAQCEVDNPSG